jgi:hypothetical protein
MLADLRVDEFAATRPEPLVRSFLVGAHQARIARHIGGEGIAARRRVGAMAAAAHPAQGLSTGAIIHHNSPAATIRPGGVSKRV